MHVELVALHTTASWDKDAPKQQICSQLEGCVAELGEGPVAPHLAFTVDHGRNWINLWKPTIDSLDLILDGPTPLSHGTLETAASPSLDSIATSTATSETMF